MPDSVVQRVAWYEAVVRRERWLFYLLDGTIIVLSAAIPITVALGAVASTAAILGAALTGIVATRQMLQPQQNWIRNTATLVALQGDIVAWSYGTKPYDGDHPERDLASQVESRVASETAQWTMLRKASAEPGTK